MEVIRATHPEDPALDMAVTHALLRAVAAGDAPPTARVYRPGATMAFGRLDAIGPGYAAAVAAAEQHGYTPLMRLGGGHAAGYDAGSLVVDVITPQNVIADGLERRFRDGTQVLVDALRFAGLDVDIGELPGEYCPGRWSVNAAGVKVAGTAQRSIRGASVLAAVVIVTGGARLRAALTDVYAALGFPWDPRTAGAAEDLLPGLTVDAVDNALVTALDARYGVTFAELDPAVLAAARQLADPHRVSPSSGANAAPR